MMMMNKKKREEYWLEKGVESERCERRIGVQVARARPMAIDATLSVCGCVGV